MILETDTQRDADRRRTKNLEQQPIAWLVHGGCLYKTEKGAREKAKRCYGAAVYPLYVDPPPREWQSLSEEEIRRLSIDCYDGLLTDPLILFARAIEQALKKKNA
jgi:hypothetical protein